MRMPNSREISEEQEDIYTESPMDGSIMIIGPPGTGKTVIAFLRAQVLNRKGNRAQILMYNHVLQKYTENISFPEPNAMKPKTLISWFYHWWKAHEIETLSGTLDNIYLNCPYDDKDKVKDLGARWDKKWYITQDLYNKSVEEFIKWEDSSFNAKSDIMPPKIKDFQYDWNAMLVEIIKRGSVNDWEHLIIDEAQDFPVSMFSFLRFAASKLHNGGLTILADENQRLNESENSTILEIKNALSVPDERLYPLIENFRNTLPIAELASCFYVGLPSGKPNLPKKKGDIPELVRTSNIDQQIDFIYSVLTVRAPGEVGIFAQSEFMRSELFTKLQKRMSGLYRVQTYSSKDKRNHPVDKLIFDSKGVLTVLNRQSCKGLEFDFVFIPELQTVDIDGSGLDTFKMNMYVMCSRAREALYLLYSSVTNETPKVIEHMPLSNTGTLEYKYV